MTLHVKDATTWKEATALYVKDGGSWKEVTDAYVKDAGSWKSFKSPTSPPSYTYTLTAAAQTGTGTIVDREISVSPESGTPYWSTSYFTLVSSDPPGFAFGKSIQAGTPDDVYHKKVRSISNTASAGTTVTLTYTLYVANISGTALSDPSFTVSYVHQF